MLKKLIRVLLRIPDENKDHTNESIAQCPWKEDITIDRSSWIGSGAYESIKGKEYHSVYCAADGPNNDKGKTMHHGWIGYWDNFQIFEEANTFAVLLWVRIKNLTGIEVPIYASRKDKNNHANWCMSKRKNRPAGIQPLDLPVTFEEYQ